MATVQQINAEIDRIDAAKTAIIAAIVAKGITVPADAMIQDLAELILEIPTMDPNDYYTKEDLANMAENWTFELSDNTTVTKKVIILPE